MQIHQISVNYVAPQDRILARISSTTGEELRAWLTRRLCLNFWPVLNQAVAAQVAKALGSSGSIASPMTHADETTRQLMAEFERNASVGKADFKTPFQAQASSLPLGQEPLLVTDISIDSAENGALRFHFQEKLPGRPQPRGFQMQMDAPILHGFVHMLDQAQARSGWMGDAATALAAPSAAPAATAKPKYLN